MLNRGLPPVIAEHPKVLILGSMPGEESIRKQQYYANSRNLFWEIMGNIFDFDKNEEYEVKIEIIKKNKIALWDVIDKCNRKGEFGFIN